jgi:restriction system protein
LIKACVLHRPARGRVRISSRGREILDHPPQRIDIAFLGQFDQFEEFRTARTSESTPVQLQPSSDQDADELSPDERLLQSYRQLRGTLAQDLLSRIKVAPPAFFEQLVVDLLVAMGYGGSRLDAGEAIGGSGDGGIDGIIKEDRLGLDFVYIQAKRWESVVGRPQIQGFAGSLEGQRARKGVFITTSSFTDNARQYVTNIEKRIVLIDGQHLADLMLDYGIGVTEVATYKVQRVDLDYFGEE